MKNILYIFLIFSSFLGYSQNKKISKLPVTTDLNFSYLPIIQDSSGQYVNRRIDLKNINVIDTSFSINATTTGIDETFNFTATSNVFGQAIINPVSGNYVNNTTLVFPGSAALDLKTFVGGTYSINSGRNSVNPGATYSRLTMDSTGNVSFPILKSFSVYTAPNGIPTTKKRFEITELGAVNFGETSFSVLPYFNVVSKIFRVYNDYIITKGYLFVGESGNVAESEISALTRSSTGGTINMTADSVTRKAHMSIATGTSGVRSSGLTLHSGIAPDSAYATLYGNSVTIETDGTSRYYADSVGNTSFSFGPTVVMSINGDMGATGEYLGSDGGGAVVWGTPSDKRLKKNVSTIKNVSEKIYQLRPVNYTYIKNNQESVGFIAQEVQEIFPEMVTTKKDGMLSLKNYYLEPYIIATLQEMNCRILHLEKKLAKFERRNQKHRPRYDKTTSED